MASRPASIRQQERRFVTPIISDVLFSERWVGHSRDVPPYGAPHPNKVKWPNHKFVYARERGEPDAQDVFDFFYAADRVNQDSYNFNFTKADIGGNKFDAVTRTYVTPRSEFNPNTPAIGDAMPDVPMGLFTGGYVLARKEERRVGDQVLDSRYVAEELTYVKRCTIRDVGVDSLNGKSLRSSETLHYATEVISDGLTMSQLFDAPSNPYWGLQFDGAQKSGRQISCEWFLVESRQVVSGTLDGTTITVDTYTTNDRYHWPAVLETHELLRWTRKDGGVEIFPALRFHPEAYQGPCKNTITRTWSKTPFDIPVVKILQPTRIYYSCPYFTVNIPESLHGLVSFQCDFGTENPKYSLNVGSTRYFAATNETTWPPNVVAYDDQEPFRGGFMRTRRVVDRPDIPPNVNWQTGAPI